MFSTVQDQQNRELTQKHIERRAKRLKVHHEELKLAPVAAELARGEGLYAHAESAAVRGRITDTDA